MAFKKVPPVQRLRIFLALLIFVCVAFGPVPVHAGHDKNLTDSQIIAGNFNPALFNKVMPQATNYGKPTGTQQATLTVEETMMPNG